MPAPSVTRAVLAELFGVDVRTIKNLVDEGMPKAARGKYDLGACVPWYLNREREQARGNKGLNDLDLARQRKTAAEARLAEIELAKAEGQSIPMEVHLARLGERLREVEGNLRGLGHYQPDVKAAVTDDQADGLLERIGDDLRKALRALGDE